MIKTLLDTGPLVAFYSTRDAWHEWVMEQMGTVPPPLLTCEPVLAEACFLLHRDGGNPRTVLRALQEGTLQVALQTQLEAVALETLMARYANVPMSLADACLVRMSEIHTTSRVFTLDRHFTRYRRHGRQLIPLLSPGF
jgi:predicted nucleic acid-binding protein